MHAEQVGERGCRSMGLTLPTTTPAHRELLGMVPYFTSAPTLPRCLFAFYFNPGAGKGHPAFIRTRKTPRPRASIMDRSLVLFTASLATIS